MGKIFLVVGGRRSGKSEFALKLGESLQGPRAFLATCPSIDSEMDERIIKHQRDRNSRIWSTVEEQVELGRVIRQNGQFRLFLVDCVTLWINNLIFHSREQGLSFGENNLIQLTGDLLDICHDSGADIIFVSNETGLGVVPDNADTRLFLDLVGRCNQMLASASEEVFMISCGIPIRLKKGSF